MKYNELNTLEQAAVALRDCGIVYTTGYGPTRFDLLVRLGLAEKCPMLHGGIAYRLTRHGHAAMKAREAQS